jgi:hypothetical protein
MTHTGTQPIRAFIAISMLEPAMAVVAQHFNDPTLTDTTITTLLYHPS